MSTDDRSPTTPTLVLGTAQFGLTYGHFGPGHPIDPVEVAEILRFGWNNGIRYLDTASEYGVAEKIIGDACPTIAKFEIVTKTPRIRSQDVYGTIREAVYRSKDLTRSSSLEAILVHEADELIGSRGAELFEALSDLKKEGVVRKIGVSVYDVNSLRTVMERYPVEIVQFPLNVFDQRFLNSGTIADLSRSGVIIQTRSAFLQGTLLAEPNLLPVHLRKFSDQFAAFYDEARKRKISRMVAALSFVLRAGVSQIVLGVDGLHHLREIVSSLENAKKVAFDAAGLAVDNLDLIDPRTWARQ